MATALTAGAAGLAVGWLAAPATAAHPGDGLVTRSAFARAPYVPSFSGTPAPCSPHGSRRYMDPDIAGCQADVRLVDKSAVMQGGAQIGALELMYSPRCGAGWAQVYLYPGQPTMMGEVFVWAGDGRSTSIADPLVKQIDDYTDVVVPGPGGCLGASGAVYRAGKRIVTATIACQSPTASGAAAAGS